MIKCNSVLIRKIVITEDFSLNEIFERRGRIYTFLNPVSYLLALEIKRYLVVSMAFLLMVQYWFPPYVYYIVNESQGVVLI